MTSAYIVNKFSVFIFRNDAKDGVISSNSTNNNYYDFSNPYNIPVFN